MNQSLPTASGSVYKTATDPKQAENSNGSIKPDIDPGSKLAHALQPLLEQEALLEAFVEEAKSQRKFEDVKTLKTNLKEIRQEIERLLARGT
jgi:rabenosyn-5